MFCVKQVENTYLNKLEIYQTTTIEWYVRAVDIMNISDVISATVKYISESTWQTNRQIKGRQTLSNFVIIYLYNAVN